MQRVGVKEFKNRASEILREVRERSAEYVITLDGEPVATLGPYCGEDRERDIDAETDEWLDEWDAFTERLARETGPAKMSAVEAVRAQRRDLP